MNKRKYGLEILPLITPIKEMFVERKILNNQRIESESSLWIILVD